MYEKTILISPHDTCVDYPADQNPSGAHRSIIMPSVFELLNHAVKEQDYQTQW